MDQEVSQIPDVYKQYKCLDHGFVRLVDYMGSDDSIVQAARVSYGAGTKQVQEDKSLIRYLMRHSHTTPFEMVEFKFHVKMPIFIARQWIRHRTASVNEYSGRYSEMKDEFYMPEPDAIRKQSTSNKQGRSEEGYTPLEINIITSEFAVQYQSSYELYDRLIGNGVAKEIARIVLPVSNYTEWYWKIDLHNLFHFLRLRLDSHAQYEMRVYAEAIATIIKQIVPVAYAAFEDYILHSVKFSRLEVEMMMKVLGLSVEKDILAEKIQKSDMSTRERVEFMDKLALVIDSPSIRDIPKWAFT